MGFYFFCDDARQRSCEAWHQLIDPIEWPLAIPGSMTINELADLLRLLGPGSKFALRDDAMSELFPAGPFVFDREARKRVGALPAGANAPSNLMKKPRRERSLKSAEQPDERAAQIACAWR